MFMWSFGPLVGGRSRRSSGLSVLHTEPRALRRSAGRAMILLCWLSFIMKPDLGGVVWGPQKRTPTI